MAAIAKCQQDGVSFLSPASDFSSLAAGQWVDVREAEEITDKPWPAELEHVREAKTDIPSGSSPERFGQLSRRVPTIVVCQRGSRSYQVALMLKRAGFENVQVLGGGLAALM
jgi:rhodanese-related sulfurtransferase